MKYWFYLQKWIERRPISTYIYSTPPNIWVRSYNVKWQMHIVPHGQNNAKCQDTIISNSKIIVLSEDIIVTFYIYMNLTPTLFLNPNTVITLDLYWLVLQYYIYL